MIESKIVTKTILGAKTAGKKSAATKLLQKYIAQQKKLGHKPERTQAAIRAALARANA